MNFVRNGLPIILLLFLVACQPGSEAPLPTRAQLPTLASTEVPPPTSVLTVTPSALPATATATAPPLPTITATPGIVIRISLTPTITLTPTDTPTPLPDAFIFGQSAGGENLVAYRAGTGEFIILLVGGVHAGFEANTVRLVEQLRDHFRQRPRNIAPDITFLFVPVLNPDGMAYPRDIRGRTNANGVDLNRNWGCGWSDEAYFREERVDSGSEPFSEPETLALGGLIRRVNPSAVLFYHAAANGVFAGDCNNATGVSMDLAAIYGEAATYPYGEPFADYPVSGTAPAWVDSLGIPAVDIELAAADRTEFERNLRGVMAVQSWISQR